ncbi:MAG: hypothetical protein ACK5HA_21330 [Planctomycetaceae bacterium]
MNRWPDKPLRQHPGDRSKGLPAGPTPQFENTMLRVAPKDTSLPKAAGGWGGSNCSEQGDAKGGVAPPICGRFLVAHALGL